MHSIDLLPNLFRKEILTMSAYKVADATGLIKLDAMENPYSWPDHIKNQWLEFIKACPLNRYPDPAANRLVAKIRQVEQIPDEYEILLGNGSDEIIQLLLMAVHGGSSILAPDPSFVMYKQLSLSMGLGYHGVALLAEGFSLDLPRMVKTIETYQPRVIFLAYPNNPTGNLFSETAIEAILAATQGLVVIDEAYTPFAETSFIDNLGRHENLVVMRTLSKLGLAGLRLGYLVGSAAIIEQLHKIRLPYNINSLTQLSAEFALDNKVLFDQQTQAIRDERWSIFTQLSAIAEIITYPSAANFILFKVPANQGDKIFASIKEQGVLIKNLSPQGNLLTDCLRVTIGTPEENTAFISALKNALLRL